MFTPKYPQADTAQARTITPTAVQPSAAVQPMPASPAPAPVPAPVARPTVQLTPGSALALVGGATAVVLVVGTVLVSLLLATAITAASVAVCAVVLRSLINGQSKR